MSRIIFLLPTIFWIWMIFECVRKDPERNIWIWILIFLNFPGAIIYFFVRYLPSANLPIPNYFQRWFRSRELWEAKAATMNIGKAHQYVILGNLYLDLGQLKEAFQAYQTALEKEQNNVQALWGAAIIEQKNQNFVEAKKYFEKLLKIDPEYKYGDASLEYIKVLLEVGEIDKVKPLLDENIKYWSKPEAYLLRAEICRDERQLEEARRHLETMLYKLRSSPKFHYKRNRHIERKGQKLLRSLR